MKRFAQPAQLLPVAFAAFFAIASVVAYASEKTLHYLTPGSPDATTLLAPPPLAGSAEQAADLNSVRAIYHTATSNDIAAAYSEKRISVFSFAGVVGDYFQSNNLPQSTAFFAKVHHDAEIVTDLGKDYFHRPRPFMMDTNLANGILERSFSYPSGHSTESMVLALVLADLVPDQRDAILARAREIGWHRVQIARHHPTDIYAGRVLAQAIVRELKQSKTFKKEFAKVKAEIEAARAAPVMQK